MYEVVEHIAESGGDDTHIHIAGGEAQAVGAVGRCGALIEDDRRRRPSRARAGPTAPPLV